MSADASARSQSPRKWAPKRAGTAEYPGHRAFRLRSDLAGDGDGHPTEGESSGIPASPSSARRRRRADPVDTNVQDAPARRRSTLSFLMKPASNSCIWHGNPITCISTLVFLHPAATILSYTTDKTGVKQPCRLSVALRLRVSCVGSSTCIASVLGCNFDYHAYCMRLGIAAKSRLLVLCRSVRNLSSASKCYCVACRPVPLRESTCPGCISALLRCL